MSFLLSVPKVSCDQGRDEMSSLESQYCMAKDLSESFNQKSSNYLSVVLILLLTTITLLLRRSEDSKLWAWLCQPLQSLWPSDTKSPPQVFSLPFVGCLRLFAGLPHLVVTKFCKSYGKIFRLSAGGDRNFVILNDVDIVRDAMRRFPSALTGKAHTTTTKMNNDGAQKDMGKRWGKRRHITMSAIKNIFKESTHMVPSVCESELQTLVHKLRSSSKQGHEPTQDITSFVARTMWKLVYGRGQDPDEKTAEQLETLATKLDDYTQNSGPFCLLDRFPLLKKLMSSSMHKYQDVVKFMNNFFIQNETKKQEEGIVLDSHSDVLDYMISGVRNLSESDRQNLELTEDLMTKGAGDLIRAGTESPALLLLWLCLVLTKYPQVQDKMAQELAALTCQTDDIPVILDVSMEKIPYTQAVVYEAVRFCSIVPFLKRRTLGKVIAAGYDLPVGTDIIINNHAINHDPSNWTDPESFCPDRFLHSDGRFNMTKLELFLPFGIGKRRCMGEEIGKLIPFAGIATLVANFEITTPEHSIDLTPSFGITLTPQKHNYIFNNRQLNNSKVLDDVHS